MDGQYSTCPATVPHTGLPVSANGLATPGNRKAVVVSSVYSASEMEQRIGREAYSYRFVYEAFAPLLRRWGKTAEVTQAESRLDYALWRARQQELQPLHLSFLPLHMMYLSRHAPNVAFPFWEFPDIPNEAFNNNLRNNWAHLANCLDLIITACTFTRDAFLRAGVTTPIRVVPVPIASEYFALPAWTPEQRAVVDCPGYVFPQPDVPAAPESNPWEAATITGVNLKARARFFYKNYIAPRVPRKIDKYLTVLVRTMRDVSQAIAEDVRIPFPLHPRLDLSGVVYTTVLNPHDPRKNLDDLLTAFLLALGDREDATLVVKLVVPPRLEATTVNEILYRYHCLGIAHRCKLVFISAYLSQRQMVELAQASTYYVNSARAEGSCLPLQSFLAAGRPGIAPAHTAMQDYFADDVGFVVDSHPEPAYWPHDPQRRLRTSWHRLVWQSLHDQLRASYHVATQQAERFRTLARSGVERIADTATEQRVWPRLAAALDAVAESTRSKYAETHGRVPMLRRVAS
ncbi:MAG TPA: hypothetical protein VGY58_14420 [Gemmataceae bacterium]|nr:hypothetical protein [Gemmataceae bacterium]